MRVTAHWLASHASDLAGGALRTCLGSLSSLSRGGAERARGALGLGVVSSQTSELELDSSLLARFTSLS